MDNNAVALAAITLAGTICAGFFRMVGKFIRSIDKLVVSNEKIAQATKKGADEAKARNGHLAELIISTAKGTQDLLDKPVHVQTVETQVVREQK